MSVHEQYYPPQTMPQIKRLLVTIPVRNGQGKEQQILGYYRPMNQVSYLLPSKSSATYLITSTVEQVTSATLRGRYLRR